MGLLFKVTLGCGALSTQNLLKPQKQRKLYERNHPDILMDRIWLESKRKTA
jgi:hypothetical protein